MQSNGGAFVSFEWDMEKNNNYNWMVTYYRGIKDMLLANTYINWWRINS